MHAFTSRVCKRVPTLATTHTHSLIKIHRPCCCLWEKSEFCGLIELIYVTISSYILETLKIQDRKVQDMTTLA